MAFGQVPGFGQTQGVFGNGPSQSAPNPGIKIPKFIGSNPNPGQNQSQFPKVTPHPKDIIATITKHGLKPPPPQTALEKWLAGDTTYQQQLAEFNKSQSDYNTNYNTQVSQTKRDYNQTQRSMNRQAQQDRMDQQNDFAGRGILHSGVYAKALGDYNTDFNTKMNNLTTGENDKLGDLSTQRTQFLRELQMQMNAAKQDAIRRRAEQLGL